MPYKLKKKIYNILLEHFSKLGKLRVFHSLPIIFFIQLQSGLCVVRVLCVFMRVRSVASDMCHSIIIAFAWSRERQP